jgi:hypothetical protein
MKKTPLKLWMRIGDVGDYEQFGDDYDAVATALQGCGGWDNVRQCPGGFNAEGFEDKNYVSLYWGDDKANLVKQLSKKDFVAIMLRVDQSIFTRDRFAEMPFPKEERSACADARIARGRGLGHEYRIVYEFIDECKDDNSTDDMLGVLDEIIESCRMFKRKFKTPY